MKRIFFKRSLDPSLILILGGVFASRVPTKSLNTQCVMTDAHKNYVYSNTAENFTDSQGRLAIGRFGAPFRYVQRGPIRFTFLDKAALGRNMNTRNWSLSVIRVM